MPTWLMKIADNTYQAWSTICDDWASEPLDREAAIRVHGEERVAFTDEHLCSCKARHGDDYQLIDGKLVHVPGDGPLAYHFDTYEEVARFCRTQEQMRADEAADALADPSARKEQPDA